MALQPDAYEPEVVSWDEFWAMQVAAEPGHILFCGPTRSGKTVLCRHMARIRDYVVVFGTKPVDPQLTAYVDEGYYRIDHWPPTKQDFRKSGWGEGEARFIVWPKITKREELRAYRHVYKDALDQIFIDGGWTVVVDEGLWLSGKSGLALGQELGDLAYGAGSNNVKLYLLVQRQANVSPVAWTSASQAMFFHMGRTDDVRELASLGTYPPRETVAVIQGLRGHQFLALPCRAGEEWVISEVENP